MPKKFSKQEKETIHAALIEQGRLLFNTYGLKKTNVEDITHGVGISKGAFYLFFDSKESLFMDILSCDEQAYRKMVIHYAMRPEKSDRENLKLMIKMAIAAWKENPALIHFTNNEYSHLTRVFPEEDLQFHNKKNERAIVGLLSWWQRQGVQVNIVPEIAIGLLKALFYFSKNELEVHPQYEAAVDILIEQVVDTIIKE